MKSYDSYKESGIKWLGKVPSHWEIKRGKYVTKLLSGFPFNSDLFSTDETDMPLIRIRDIMNTSTESFYSGPYPKAYIIKKGDVLVGMDGDFNVAIWNGPDGLLNQRVCKVVDMPEFCARYASYVLPRPLRCINDITYSTTVKHLSTFDIYREYFPVPPIGEQQAIADYLDAECKKIDDLIKKEEKRVQLIEETKLSIITKVITKGFDTDKELVNSGIDWVGKIPSDWVLWKTSHLFAGIGSGTTPKSSDSSYYDDEGHYWLQTGDLNDGHITNTSKKVSDKAVSEKNLRFYPANSLVIAMYGATIGKLGILDIETSTNQACCVLPPSKKVLPMFAFYHFMAAKQDLINQSAGGGQPNISQDIIRRHKIALPPTIDDQRAIVDYISEKTIKYDATLRKAHKMINTLKEYKHSLITEIVTGKRKVC